MTLARLPIFIFDLLPTFCPPALNIASTKKWRWPDFFLTCPRPPSTYYLPTCNVIPTEEWRRPNIGRSVRSWHVFKKLFNNLSQMITTTCIACFRPMPLQILNKLHHTALGCPFLGSFIITVVTIFVIIFHESAFTVTIT